MRVARTFAVGSDVSATSASTEKRLALERGEDGGLFWAFGRKVERELFEIERLKKIINACDRDGAVFDEAMRSFRAELINGSRDGENKAVFIHR